MRLNTGLFSFDLKAIPDFARPVVEDIYGDAANQDKPIDFEISLNPPSLLRRIVKPQIMFTCDQHTPFKPLPFSQTYPLLEWGMNWCIAAHNYYHLILHSAVLVKGEKAILFPAHPGSGKSTLTAYLSLKDWTIYSDEMALINPDDLLVNPMYRPICLKNRSIDLVKSWYPKALVTPKCKDTQKGDVSHVKAINWNMYTTLSPVKIVAAVFPKYVANSETHIYQLSKLQGFEKLIVNAFNYNVMGLEGFEIMNQILDRIALFEVEYSDLDEVSGFLDSEVLKK